jgi:hypothetical protein
MGCAEDCEKEKMIERILRHKFVLICELELRWDFFEILFVFLEAKLVYSHSIECLAKIKEFSRSNGTEGKGNMEASSHLLCLQLLFQQRLALMQSTEAVDLILVFAAHLRLFRGSGGLFLSRELWLAEKCDDWGQLDTIFLFISHGLSSNFPPALPFSTSWRRPRGFL